MNMILVVVGMFVLVWIISAVMKATQSVNPPKPPPRPLPPNRNRPANQQQQQPEKTTNSDLERFMAEIDKLRTRGDAPPPPQTRPAANPQPTRTNQPAPARGETPARPRGERRPNNRRTSAPPPLPPKTAEVPVLRPVTPPPEIPAPAPGGTSHTLPGFKQAKTARMASSGGGTLRGEVSPVLKTLQTILKGDQGPAIAMVLTEIFGEPKCRKKF